MPWTVYKKTALVSRDELKQTCHPKSTHRDKGRKWVPMAGQGVLRADALDGSAGVTSACSEEVNT